MMWLFRTSFPVLRSRCSVARFCTVHLKEQLPEGYRTFETNPVNHTLEHEGKFYRLDPEVSGTVFKYGGFSAHLQEQIAIIGEPALMVRRPALEVMHYLKTADYSMPPIRYVLYSKNVGSGMTTSLAHIIHYAWLRKWVIVHCHDCFSWVRYAWPSRFAMSQYNPTRLDQNQEAGEWLEHFKMQNQHHLNQIKLSKSYTWSKREISEKGQPLGDVVEHGLARALHATDCVAVILKEIKLQSGPNSFRTLVVIDGLNAFFGDCRHKRPDATKLTVDELSLLRGFKKLLSNDWSNAAVVVSADTEASYTLPKPRPRPKKVLWPDRNPYVHKLIETTEPIERERHYFPKQVLGNKAFSILDPFVPIEVFKYSLKEFHSCYDYYTDSKLIQNEKAISEEGRQEILFLSGRIPKDLLNYCLPL